MPTSGNGAKGDDQLDKASGIMGETTDLTAESLAKAQDVLDRFNEALAKTNVATPSENDRQKLDSLLQEFPFLWDMAGDLMTEAADKLIGQLRGTYAMQAALRTGWQQLPEQLKRPDDGPLEWLLLQQCVLSWLQLGYIEYQFNAFLTQGEATGSNTEFWDRRLSAAQRRYLRAFETLARVRRLQLPSPPTQINIAAQQVNQIKQGR